jgi:hypothetical protein
VPCLLHGRCQASLRAQFYFYLKTLKSYLIALNFYFVITILSCMLHDKFACSTHCYINHIVGLIVLKLPLSFSHVIVALCLSFAVPRSTVFIKPLLLMNFLKMLLNRDISATPLSGTDLLKVRSFCHIFNHNMLF